MRLLAGVLAVILVASAHASPPSARRCQRACRWAAHHCGGFGSPTPRRCVRGLVARCNATEDRRCFEPPTTTTTEAVTTSTTSTSTSTTSSTEVPATLETTTSTSTTSVSESSTTTTLGGVDNTPPFCVEPGTIIPPQSPDCAGPTSAYVQIYQFCGHLVSNNCAPSFEPSDPATPLLHITQAGTNKSLSGELASTLGNVGEWALISGGAQVTGSATYPAWETEGPVNLFGAIAGTHGTEIVRIGDGTLWTAMDGLPRERAGCQQVSGAFEVRVATPVECVIRYEGAWTWLDN